MSKRKATTPVSAGKETPKRVKGKVKVGVLGVTGTVGQRFVELLENHPWFELATIAASDRSAGKAYKEAVQWKLGSAIPAYVRDMAVTTCESKQFEGVQVIFSALDADVAGPIEEEFATAGMLVFSNAKNHRMDPDVPLLVAPVNPDHLGMLAHQRKSRGYTTGGIVCNANCSSTGLVIALAPLERKFGLEKVFVVTMQAISGAGYPGVASLDILDNVVPFISGEEPKLEKEPLKILGGCSATAFKDADFKVSAHCNRVPVMNGHTECVSVKLRKKASVKEVEAALREYTSELTALGLPSAPPAPIVLLEGENRPQPRLDRDVGGGFVCTVGRVRECALFDFKLVLLSHNTVIGAAGGALQNAELAYAKSYV